MKNTYRMFDESAYKLIRMANDIFAMAEKSSAEKSEKNTKIIKIGQAKTTKSPFIQKAI